MLPFLPVLYYLAGPAPCTATWTHQIELAKAHAAERNIGSFGLASCKYDEELEIVPCDPEKLRAATEVALHRLELYPPGKRLSMEVYAIARNIASEAGSGSATEKAIIAEVAFNRARHEGWTLGRVLMKDGTRFGRQRGQNPAVSTRRNPRWEDMVAAELVASGLVSELAAGATHYWSPRTIDWMHGEGRHRDDRWSLYERWSKWAGWVGPIAGIDHNRQFLMDASLDDAERRRRYPVGAAALEAARAPAVATAPVCQPDERRAPLLATAVGIAVAASTVFMLVSVSRST